MPEIKSVIARLTTEQEVELFKRLAYKSTLEAGYEFGLENIYKDKTAIRNAVKSVYAKVKANPSKYGVDDQVVQVVADAMAHRNIAGARKEISQAEQEIDTKDIKTMVVGVRDKAFRLLDLKLTRASKSKKALDALNIVALSTTAATMFDKAQIIQGQATEHIAVMGKIDGNIKPDEAIDLILRMRESNIAQHASKKHQ